MRQCRVTSRVWYCGSCGCRGLVDSKSRWRKRQRLAQLVMTAPGLAQRCRPASFLQASKHPPDPKLKTSLQLTLLDSRSSYNSQGAVFPAFACFSTRQPVLKHLCYGLFFEVGLSGDGLQNSVSRPDATAWLLLYGVVSGVLRGSITVTTITTPLKKLHGKGGVQLFIIALSRSHTLPQMHRQGHTCSLSGSLEGDPI